MKNGTCNGLTGKKTTTISEQITLTVTQINRVSNFQYKTFTSSTIVSDGIDLIIASITVHA